MKSFLNRFRRKEDDEQPSAAPTTPFSPADAAAGSSEEKPLRRTGISVAPPSQAPPGETNENRAGEPEPANGGTAPENDDLVLELGDFLHRIPPQLLRPGTPDVHTELRFCLADISERIARNETSVPLSEIYAKVPHIFNNEILEADDLAIRFPWQKVLKLINETAPGTAPTSSLTIAAAESLAYKLKTRHAARNIVIGRGVGGLNVPESPLGKAGSKLAQRPVTWFSRPPASHAPVSEQPSSVSTATSRESTSPKLSPPETDSPADGAQTVEETTVLIETVRAEFQQELERALRGRDEEMATVRQDYQRQIDALKGMIQKLQSELAQARGQQPDPAPPASSESPTPE